LFFIFLPFEFRVLFEQLNGKYTLGENIADNGGLKLGYGAYQKVKASSAPEKPLPGLSLNPEQLIFVGFAQVCRAQVYSLIS
jgi:predicted metalloendopeptidase